jgi:mono/diheme cytochrome c family protein
MSKIMRLMALGLMLVACSTSENINETPDNLPAGDAARGAALFTQSVNGAPPCSSCHSSDSSNGVGPSFAGFGDSAAVRDAALSSLEYAFYSIVQPARHTVPGYPNVMYSQYGARLSSQDIADLVAYVLSR